MPGYYVHLSTCHDIARQNRSFEIGVEAPDILKTYFKLYGLEGAKTKYDQLKTDDMPDFSVLEKRIQQRETLESTDGLHYGISSNPAILYFWKQLTQKEQQNPFQRGYAWHLITDKAVYYHLAIDTSFAEFAKQHEACPNLELLLEQERKKLHNDWDRINSLITETYRTDLTPEIAKLNIVKYLPYSTNDLEYVNWDILHKVICELRKFDPLHCDIPSMVKFIQSGY